MVRTQGPPTDDPFYRRGRSERSSFTDDALPLDAGLTEADEDDEPQQFRRASRRVPVKRGALPRKWLSRARTAALAVLAVGALGTAVYQIDEYAMHSGRFLVRSESNIEMAGAAPNSRAQVMEKMRAVVGHNLFQISLVQCKQELETIPWVESATVMRLWPNRLRVSVRERTPVAFVDLGGNIELIDAQGVVMEMTPGVPAAYSFPVIRGMTASDPLALRAARMKTFMRLVHELDGDGGAQSGGQSGGPGKVQYSRNLQEVELSDPGDVKVTVDSGTGPVLLHLGDEDFLPRFMVYLANVQRWEQERGKLDSVDLRYGREVILNPDMSAAPPSAAPAPAPAVAPPAARPKVARIAAAHARARAAMVRRHRHHWGKKRK